MLQIRSLTKNFGHFTVWEDISLTLERGSILGLFGVNGSGKTTLLKSIAGIVSPSSGEILLDGKDLRKHPAERRRLGFLTHQSMYYHDLTCLENLRFTAGLYGMRPDRNDLLQRLKAVGLERWADEPARFFSRGMLQRLAVAKSLLHDPDIILYDEPFTGLDEEAADTVTAVLRNSSLNGKSVILVTHDLKQGFELSDTLALLTDHRLSLLTPKNEIGFDEFHSHFKEKYS